MTVSPINLGVGMSRWFETGLPQTANSIFGSGDTVSSANEVFDDSVPAKRLHDLLDEVMLRFIRATMANS